MKKSLIYSLILHIILLSLAFFIVNEKGRRDFSPFFAHIVTPEDLKKEMPPAKKTLSKLEKQLSKEFTKMSKLPKDLSPPRELSSLPTMKESIEEYQGLSSDKGSDIKENGKVSGYLKDSLTKKDEKTERNGTEKSIGKEKLFDKEIISKLAKRQKEEKKEENNITFDTREFRYYGYLQRLKEKIESIWRYPSDAAEKGIYGDLYIRFTIKKDGRLGNIELVRTSGHKSLDDAAIKALKDAEPYWPLPEEWGKDGFTITGHFIYTLHGIYIR